MTCQHTKTRILTTTGFTGPVYDRGTEENRAAHGNVVDYVECTTCGARRSEAINGRHVEVSSWGATADERQALLRERKREVVRLQRAIAGTEACLRRGEDEATVTIDDEGYLVVTPDGPTGEEIARAWPRGFAAALKLRQAHKDLARLERLDADV